MAPKPPVDSQELEKTRPGGHKKRPGPVPGQRFEISVPQCKICQLSPHVRWNIEMELTSGFTQKAIADRWNYFLHEEDPTRYGETYLNKANVSTHGSRHMTTREMAIRHIVEEAAKSQIAEIEATTGIILTKQGIAEAIAVSGLQNIAKGITVVEPKETLGAIELLKDMESEQSGPALDELWRQFYAFQDAVRRVVPEAMYVAIAEEFERMIGGASVRPQELTQGNQVLEQIDLHAEKIVEIIEDAEYLPSE